MGALGYATAYLPDEPRKAQLKALATFAAAGYDEPNATLTVLTQLAPMLEVLGPSVPVSELSAFQPFLSKQSQSDKYFVRQAAVHCLGYLVTIYGNNDTDLGSPRVGDSLRAILRAFNDSSDDVRGGACSAVGTMFGAIDNERYLSSLRQQMLGKLLKYVNERKHVVKIAATNALATALHADQKDEEEVMKVVASECPTIAAALRT